MYVKGRNGKAQSSGERGHTLTGYTVVGFSLPFGIAGKWRIKRLLRVPGETMETNAPDSVADIQEPIDGSHEHRGRYIGCGQDGRGLVHVDSHRDNGIAELPLGCFYSCNNGSNDVLTAALSLPISADLYELLSLAGGRDSVHMHHA